MTGSNHVEQSKCSTAGMVTFSLGLISGTFSALFCKMAYDTSATGLDGKQKLFAKPMMMLLLMFTAMAPAIVFWLIQQAMRKPHEREVVSYRTMAILAIPSICDLLCTLLLLVAQIYITASMWQMLRGSVIVFTALMKRFLLQHRLRMHMWWGVFIICVAMVLVAATSFLEPSSEKGGSAKDPRIGVVLVIFGCLAQGLQYVFEEKVMAVDNAPPLVVIGCEGLWGMLISLVIVYPIAYAMPGSDNGSYEDPWDAIHMIKSSSFLQWLLVGFVIFVTIYNCMAVYVTKYLSAIWHAILDNFRPVTIWILDLYIFYGLFPGQGFGEAWTNASFLQLAGLLTLFIGTAVYDGKVTTCDSEEELRKLSTTPSGKELLIEKIPMSMSSPVISKSPLITRVPRKAEPPKSTGWFSSV